MLDINTGKYADKGMVAILRIIAAQEGLAGEHGLWVEDKGRGVYAEAVCCYARFMSSELGLWWRLRIGF